MYINLLNAELNPICHLLELLGAHHILHVSRIRVYIHLYLAQEMSGLYLHSPTYLNNVRNDICTLSRIKLHRCHSHLINLQTAMLVSNQISGT